MKKLFTLLLMLSSLYVFSQEKKLNYKEYSYTEFFKLIENEKDTIFKLKDAIIKYNKETDQRFRGRFSFEGDSLFNRSEKIVIDKRIELDNVQFLANMYNEADAAYNNGSLRYIHFKKDVILKEVNSLNISNCIFSGEFDLDILNCEKESLDTFNSDYVMIRYSTFNEFSIFKNCFQNLGNQGNVLISNNVFSSEANNTTFHLGLYNTSTAQIRKNTINSKGIVSMFFEKQGNRFDINNNNIASSQIDFSANKIDAGVNINGNQFSSLVNLNIDEIKSKDKIEWEQFKNKILSFSSYYEFTQGETNKMMWQIDTLKRKQLTTRYVDSVRFYKADTYANEISIKGMFYNYYKSNYNTETANEVYIELKDFETKRLEALYKENSTFKGFFTWKINQFLKVFSAYGTEPARAVIFSMWVILLFAFIYLLFPNSWDSHGKKRLMHRFEFFQKYLRRKEGMHTIYLEENKQEISSYENFKTNLENSKTELPSFFISWSKPLYNASMFSSKLTAKLLQNTDILKGKWQDLSPKQKRWKNIQIGFLLTIGLFYDLFIKALNALMLSINTFTTLGFGEIPIKGLPRYLAIIQGFIGWFMLTIFSVSLISQLLN